MKADTWYLVIGACVILIFAVFFVVQAILSLRRDDAVASGGNSTADHGTDVKVQDGATYTVVKRSSPAAAQRSHYWLGDNGQEIELTQEEVARLS